MNSIKTVLAATLLVGAAACSPQKGLKDDALAAMKAATAYMMDSVSVNGGFVWAYLPDFSRQWGEMEATRSMAWTQSPGTPGIGHVMLDAYHATGDEYYYDCALKVAKALIWGQLDCGGWNYVFDFEGEEHLRQWYSTVGASGWRLEEFQHYYGNATFDDSASTDCARFMLRMYLEKGDGDCLASLEKAIGFVLDSQYPCGGWPQRYPLMYDHPFRGKADYTSFVTLNDSVTPDAVEFLQDCARALDRPELDEAASRGMYLLRDLQQPSPLAGWSDQYFVESLKPAHARSYEPAGINAGTTQSMIRLMEKYYLQTGDRSFVEGIPAALDYLESSAVSAEEAERWGRPTRDSAAVLVPRFIDPDSGLPQYVHREGTNVYNGRYYCDQDISGTIGHYSSAAWVNVGALREGYEALMASEWQEPDDVLEDDGYYFHGRGEDEAAVREIVSSLDSLGRWLSPLGSTSNPYKAGADPTPSHEKAFASTNVGDEFDTSPYRCTDGTLCISTRDFIQKMTALVEFVK